MGPWSGSGGGGMHPEAPSSNCERLCEDATSHPGLQTTLAFGLGLRTADLTAYPPVVRREDQAAGAATWRADLVRTATEPCYLEPELRPHLTSCKRLASASRFNEKIW